MLQCANGTGSVGCCYTFSNRIVAIYLLPTGERSEVFARCVVRRTSLTHRLAGTAKRCSRSREARLPLCARAAGLCARVGRELYVDDLRTVTGVCIGLHNAQPAQVARPNTRVQTQTRSATECHYPQSLYIVGRSY